MSLGNCIPGLIEAGKLTKAQGKKAQGAYDRQYARLSREMGPVAAAAEASERALNQLEFEARQVKRTKLLQAAAQIEAEKWLRGGGEKWGRSGRDGAPPPPGSEMPDGPINPKAARTLILRVEARRRAIESRAFGLMHKLLARHSRNAVGVLRHRADLDDIGRAAFGEAVDNASARELADSFGEAAELMRKRANAAGAAIGKLDRWGLPQRHDSRAVAEAGFDVWYAAELPRLDRARMIDDRTGAPFEDDTLEEAMRAVFATIASDGRSGATPGAAGKSSYASTMNEHRFIHYKDYDSWAASRAQFGGVTAFDAMVGHIRGMSRQVAAMEMLGPNPEATVRWLGDMIEGEERLFLPGALRDRDAAHTKASKVQRLWEQYSGDLSRPESRAMAKWGGGYRAIATSAKLGSAFISAASDIGFGMATRRFNGLPIAGILRDYAKLFNPLSEADRKLAARNGLIADVWIDMVAGQNRFLAEEVAGEVGARFAEGVLRVSGLMRWTDTGRLASGNAFIGHITDESVKGWGDLHPRFQAVLQRYGIDEAGWEGLRHTPLDEDGGAHWLRPHNVQDRELGDRLLEMIHSEADFAVPIADLETRAVMNARLKPGTWLGELVRSGPLLFKSFGVAVMLRHGTRMMEQPSLPGKVGYALSLAVPLVVMGAFSQQMSELARGRDPRPMEDPEFWSDAAARSGGFSVLGDFIGATLDERPGGAARWAVGPLFQDAEALARAGAGSMSGEDERAAWKAARVAKGYVPGQNLWYTRLMTDRLLADQLQMLIDPEADDAYERMQRKAEREFGQEMWWGPGETAPERAPDIANAWEGEVPEN